MTVKPMTDPAVKSEGQTEPARPPLADDLGKMWGQEAVDTQTVDTQTVASPPGDRSMEDEINPSDTPKLPDPRERREIGEAVADLDNPPHDNDLDLPVDPPGGQDVILPGDREGDHRGPPDADPVTGSWA